LHFGQYVVTSLGTFTIITTSAIKKTGLTLILFSPDCQFQTVFGQNPPINLSNRLLFYFDYPTKLITMAGSNALLRKNLNPEKQTAILMKLLPFIAFLVPFVWLYFLDASSFDLMWKGRTFQLFFLWLISLELILSWQDLQSSNNKKNLLAKKIALIATSTIPTIYVGASYYLGLNQIIQSLASRSNIPWANSMALSTEYLVFATLFSMIVFLAFGAKGLKTFFIPAFFLCLVGALYTIDNVFPYGQFTPFQIFVPTTTSLAAIILNLLGYNTNISYGENSLQGTMPFLTATDPNQFPSITTTYAIAWPCAGIESFLIFTVTIFLFLKRMNLSLKSKIFFFMIGAVITYIINALRIVNIFLIGMAGGNIEMFHFYYGPLYAVVWITAYPIIIIGSQILWRKIKKPSSKRNLLR
jgi:thaumarchaeosortase